MKKRIYYMIISVMLTWMLCNCATVKTIDKCELVKKITCSDEFSKFYNLCSTYNDTIIIYDSRNLFLDCNSFVYNTSCSKFVKLEKINFKIDGPSLMQGYRDKVERLILDDYSVHKDEVFFKFINMLNLQTFTLKCNLRGENIKIADQGAIDF